MAITKKIKTKVTVVGAGYVGMSLAALLSQNEKVTVFDIDKNRVDKINNRESTVADSEIENFLAKKDLNLIATDEPSKAYQGADFIIVATPTNFDASNNKFDTSSVDSVVKHALKVNLDCLIVIKSTVPVGYTESLQKLYNTKRVIFSPEFLRESRALYDNLYPTRIVIGSTCQSGRDFAILLINGAVKPNIKTLFVQSTEAESIKLFANTYLAMRVSFFNELDSFALANELDTQSIIDGVCLDERIGEGYNNPSFGYGGYCLPKDTKQLLANYDLVPQTLMQAIVSSNATRKDFIAKEILKHNPKIVGFYRLVMKEGSDNFRSSAIQGVIRRIIKDNNVKVVIYEPDLLEKNFIGLEVIEDIEHFKAISDVIVANRMAECLKDVVNKCFSRDLFGSN
jgi:UDPglucose 6-dehydrogenase